MRKMHLQRELIQKGNNYSRKISAKGISVRIGKNLEGKFINKGN